MEYVREIVDSSVLDHALTLPRSFHDRKVEIMLFPVPDNEKTININQQKINELMEGSVTQSLIGSVPHPDISLEEIRSLRLKKYDGSH